jgi:hypothetical protein
MSVRARPEDNDLLAALPQEERERIFPDLELLELALGDTLYSPGTAMRHVVFPTTAIVSLLHIMENGSQAEIAVVGHEGMVGVALFMGGETTPSRGSSRAPARLSPARNLSEGRVLSRRAACSACCCATPRR